MARGSVEFVIKEAISKYKYAEIATKDVINAVGQFKDLRPEQEIFYFGDGRRKEFLNLSGTIPVMYKGRVYNIPVIVWLLDTHPYNPPKVYVKPTSDMSVKVSRFVDANGKVDLPYLRDWKYPQSDLLPLMQILTVVFGEEPPVYSKSTASQQGHQGHSEQGEPLLHFYSASSQQRHQDQSEHFMPYVNKEENDKRLLRFVKLVRLSRDALQIFFDDIFPARELQTMLADNEHLIKNQETSLHKDQIAVLYPDGGEPADSIEFGISTMYTLLRNYAENVDPPSNGWGNEPNIGQKRQGDDVERIRIHRNALCQMIEFELEMADFNLKWEDLKQASLRLSKGILRREMAALST